MSYLFQEHRFSTAALSLVVSIILSLLLCGCSRRDEILFSQDPAPAETVSETISYETVEETEQEKTVTVYVHVCGAVNAPGVYQLPDKSRYYEAIAKAGGFRENADQDYINLAREVADGEKITVPTYEEARALRAAEENAAAGEGDPSSSGKVNLNTADLSKLCTLPGVGETRARSIIAYRENNGGFQKIEDIMKVSGIKDGLFQKIKDLITV